MSRRSPALRAALAAALSLAILAPPAFGGDVSRTYYGTGDTQVEMEANFTNPPLNCNPGPGCEDKWVNDQTIRLIDSVPAAETIAAGVHSLNAPGIIGALQRAKDRGVKIYMVNDGKDWEDANVEGSALRQLMSSLDPWWWTRPDRMESGNNDFQHWCDHGYSGIPQGYWPYGKGCVSWSSTGIMHSKYLLFTKAKNRDGVLKPNVTWWGSANLSTSTNEAFNSTVTVYNHSQLWWDTYWRVFIPMWQEQSPPGNDFFDASASPPRGYVTTTTPPIRFYASPDQGPDTDLYVRRLRDLITPSEADSNCEIRVMHMMFNRPDVADYLADLRRGDADGVVDGCKIYVVVGEKLDANGNTVGKIDDNIRDQFRGLGITVKHNHVHEKSMLFEDNQTGEWAVLNGSHNLSIDALRHNDELLGRISGSLTDASHLGLYTKYFEHFGHAYSTGATVP
jgi:hypothetical protein